MHFLLGIPSTIMGVTVLAAGTSIPDALSSVDVAQDRQGNMAVANAVGSNVFDIWLGLGLPWLFVIPFIGKSSTYGKYIEVDNDELLLSVGILFAVLIFYIVCIITSGWRIDKRHGYVFILLYLVYALYYIIVEWALDV